MAKAERKLDYKKSKVIGLLHQLIEDSGDNRLRSGEYASDRIRIILTEVGGWPEKPMMESKTKKRKRPVNVMRNKNKRFPHQDIFAAKQQGFGHSRGK